MSQPVIGGGGGGIIDREWKTQRKGGGGGGIKAGERIFADDPPTKSEIIGTSGWPSEAVEGPAKKRRKGPRKMPSRDVMEELSFL